MTFEVPKLDPPESISPTIFKFIGIGAAVIGVIGLGGGIYYMRTRRRFNYKGKPKMD